MIDNFRRALQCARHFRRLGLCPLPSRTDKKAPDLHSFEKFWESPVPDSVYTEDNWRTSNIQVMTGAKTPGAIKVIVVDCDGPEAVSMWSTLRNRHKHKAGPGWIAITGSGGRHHYFRLPDGMEECPSGLIWGLWDTFGDDGKGKWVKHKELRILGDRGLAVAPPSIHVDTGKRYEFLSFASPKIHPLPEVAPQWLLDMSRLVAPRCVELPKVDHVMKSPRSFSGASYGRDEVFPPSTTRSHWRRPGASQWPPVGRMPVAGSLALFQAEKIHDHPTPRDRSTTSTARSRTARTTGRSRCSTWAWSLAGSRTGENAWRGAVIATSDASKNRSLTIDGFIGQKNEKIEKRSAATTRKKKRKKRRPDEKEKKEKKKRIS